MFFYLCLTLAACLILEPSGIYDVNIEGLFGGDCSAVYQSNPITMVGILGRSQGCYTCRRRKIKCDTGKPYCQKCLVSKRICEGYGRPVILNRPAEDLMRPREVVPDNVETGIEVGGFAMPPQLQQSRAMRHRIEGMFLERYLAVSNASEWPSPGSYVLEVITALPRDWVLDPAIQALCVTKIGRIQRDIRLVQQGYQAYMLALKRLQFAVSNSEHVSSDSTFAAAKILNLHEIYEPTLESVSGLYSHTAGLTSLLLKKGPEIRRSSKATRLILEASRYNAMIASIQKRQDSSILARAEWRTDSRESITDFEQSLYDIGFDIGNFLAFVERFKSQETGDQDPGTNMINKAVIIDKSLSSWSERFILWAPKPAVSRDFAGRISFPHIVMAHIYLDYWSLKIVFNTVLEKLLAIVNGNNELQRLTTESHSDSMMLAEHIASAMQYCRQPNMGHVGPQRTMFANCISLSFYRRIEAQDKVKQVIRTMRELHTQNGLHFADDIKDSALPGWAKK